MILLMLLSIRYTSVYRTMEASSERERKANCFSSSNSRMDFFGLGGGTRQRKKLQSRRMKDEIHGALTRWNLNFPCFETKWPQ